MYIIPQSLRKTQGGILENLRLGDLEVGKVSDLRMRAQTGMRAARLGQLGRMGHDTVSESDDRCPCWEVINRPETGGKRKGKREMEGQCDSGANYPHGGSGLASRGKRITLTEGLSYPHGGFGLASPARQHACNDIPARVRREKTARRGRLALPGRARSPDAP